MKRTSSHVFLDCGICKIMLRSRVMARFAYSRWTQTRTDKKYKHTMVAKNEIVVCFKDIVRGASLYEYGRVFQKNGFFL